jgi:hypothetical protein
MRSIRSRVPSSAADAADRRGTCRIDSTGRQLRLCPPDETDARVRASRGWSPRRRIRDDDQPLGWPDVFLRGRHLRLCPPSGTRADRSRCGKSPRRDREEWTVWSHAPPDEPGRRASVRDGAVVAVRGLGVPLPPARVGGGCPRVPAHSGARGRTGRLRSHRARARRKRYLRAGDNREGRRKARAGFCDGHARPRRERASDRPQRPARRARERPTGAMSTYLHGGPG